MSSQREIATLGGGCFWCVEAVFELVKGVDSVVSGYAGGHVPNPTYEQVCTKTTGHAEVIQVTFDPAVISYRELLGLFFAFHNPTTPNRQGADTGPQYRSVIFTHSDEQQKTATEVVAELDAAKVFPARIVTEVRPAPEFYPAEDYHQGFYRSNPGQPYCAAVAGPKVAKLRSQYAKWLR